MEKKTRNNIERAAKLLSNFDMLEAADCQVCVYFYDRCAEQVLMYEKKGTYTDRAFLTWGQNNWKEFIEEGIRHYLGISKFSPDEVLSIIIKFKAYDKPNAKKYHIEASNLSRCDFNRILICEPSGKIRELSLSFKEKQQARSVDKVVGIANSGDANNRLIEVSSALPRCCILSAEEISKNFI
jgi:hypothetical protein